MNILQHRTNEALANIKDATTPHAKAVAMRRVIVVKADLEKQISDIHAVAAFKSALPQTSAGIWKGSDL